jgi:DNA adenine methylase
VPFDTAQMDSPSAAQAWVAGPALRYHGGKYRLAPWIMRFFPPHGCYVEPFGGAAGVLLQKPRAYAEVYNDLDGDIVNFFRVLRDPGMRVDLIEACRLTPYAREEFEVAYELTDDPLERARRTAVRAAMGFGSAGATKARTGFRTDTRRKYGTAQHVWADYPATLAAVGDRFTGVLIENRPAIDVIRAHDGPETLHFVDPPYLHETRVMRSRGGYRHEMSDEEHRQLLQVLKQAEGMVVLCGYPSKLYEAELVGWQAHCTEARISAGRGTALRTECVWLNAACQVALARRTGDLFEEA